MYRLEVYDEHDDYKTCEYSRDLLQLKATKRYYSSIRPDQTYVIYNDVTDEVVA